MESGLAIENTTLAELSQLNCCQDGPSSRSSLIFLTSGKMVHPAADIVKLGGIVSSISGLPYVAVLLLYPLVFALIMGISAVLWSEVYVRTAGRRATPR